MRRRRRRLEPGKSREKPHLPCSTEHNLLAKHFAKNRSFLEEEEGNGAAEGRGGLAEGLGGGEGCSGSKCQKSNAGLRFGAREWEFGAKAGI